MSDQNQVVEPKPKADLEAIKKLYSISIETRNFEINQLVQRNNFFMIFQGVLLAGVAQASGGSPSPVVVFLVCAGGTLVSLFQTRMAAGAKFWQERWEHEVDVIEKRLIELFGSEGDRRELYLLFSRDVAESEKIVRDRVQGKGIAGLLTAQRYSVSSIPIYIGIVFFSLWLCLLISTVNWSEFPCFHQSFLSGFPKPKYSP